jgi:tetratricopeptide (TPR) repeat protein
MELADERLARAEALMSEGELEQAVRQLDELLQDDSGSVEGLNLRAAIYRELEDYDRALADALEAAKLSPASAYLWFNAGLLENDRGDQETAVGFFTRALELDPEYGAALYCRGSTHFYVGGYADAYRDYRAAYGLGEDESDLHFHWGLCCERMGRPSEALEHYEAAWHREPSAATRTRMGYMCYLLGRDHDAREHLEDAAITDEGDTEALVIRVAMAARSGNTEERDSQIARLHELAGAFFDNDEGGEMLGEPE